MILTPKPLTAVAFAPFGQVVENIGKFDFKFNENRADRWHDFLKTDVDEAGRMGVSIAVSRPVTLPYALTMVERHPLGSQAFIPLNEKPFLVIVARDEGGKPASPEVFITNGLQGINYARNAWHGVLSPLDHEQRFMIVDRVEGDGNNLEIFDFEAPFVIE